VRKDLTCVRVPFVKSAEVVEEVLAQVTNDLESLGPNERIMIFCYSKFMVENV
jgi:hypothetical protein